MSEKNLRRGDFEEKKIKHFFRHFEFGVLIELL